MEPGSLSKRLQDPKSGWVSLFLSLSLSFSPSSEMLSGLPARNQQTIQKEAFMVPTNSELTVTKMEQWRKNAASKYCEDGKWCISISRRPLTFHSFRNCSSNRSNGSGSSAKQQYAKKKKKYFLFRCPNQIVSRVMETFAISSDWGQEATARDNANGWLVLAMQVKGILAKAKGCGWICVLKFLHHLLIIQDTRTLDNPKTKWGLVWHRSNLGRHVFSASLALSMYIHYLGVMIVADTRLSIKLVLRGRCKGLIGYILTITDPEGTNLFGEEDFVSWVLCDAQGVTFTEPWWKHRRSAVQ